MPFQQIVLTGVHGGNGRVGGRRKRRIMIVANAKCKMSNEQDPMESGRRRIVRSDCGYVRSTSRSGHVNKVYGANSYDIAGSTRCGWSCQTQPRSVRRAFSQIFRDGMDGLDGSMDARRNGC